MKMMEVKIQGGLIDQSLFLSSLLLAVNLTQKYVKKSSFNDKKFIVFLMEFQILFSFSAFLWLNGSISNFLHILFLLTGRVLGIFCNIIRISP